MSLLGSFALLLALAPAQNGAVRPTPPSSVQQWTGLVWPTQLDTPSWRPRIAYLRTATGLVGRPLLGPQLRLLDPKRTAKWALHGAPTGMRIDANNRIVWSQPVEGRYAIRIEAEDHGEIEETDWLLNVLKSEIPDAVVHSTRHMDYVVTPTYAEWMRTSGADRVVDAYYEFGRDLVGGLPSDIRQSLIDSPSIGGAHSGDPIVSGTMTFGDNEANRWRLGFLFHELGHDLNAWTRVGLIEHGDDVADNTLHDMVEFDKIAWVARMLKSPEAQGVSDVPHFQEWMKAESMEFVDGFDRYMDFVRGGGDFLRFKDGQSVPWAGMVHRYAFEYGGDALERCLRAIRRDGIPLAAYPTGKLSAAQRLTMVMCVMSNAAGRDLRGWFLSKGMPLDRAMYDRLYGTVAAQMANLPAVGKNGAFRCPADGHYYMLTPYGTTWATAEATARRLGGHLATIRSAAQEKWLANKFAPDGWLWVGCRRDEDGQWHWITQERTAEPIWEPERPESDPAKTCGVLIHHEDSDKAPWFGMANRPPDERLFGIIELQRPPVLDVDDLP